MFGVRVRGRVVSAVTAVAVAGVSLLGAGVAAASAASVADIDPGKADEGKIVVHKRTQPAGDSKPGDGSELQNPPGDPLGGVEFTLYRVKASDGGVIDLGLPAGWSAARSVIEGFSPAELDNQVTPTKITTDNKTYGLEKVGSKTTAGDGVATFDTKNLGLYLLVESDPATDKTGVVAAAEPALVTVPYASEQGGWKYQVHVYPKNAVQDLSKTVENNGSVIGKDVTFSVTGKVPNPTGGKELTSFKIVDQLDPRLKFDTITNFTLAGQTLTEGNGYTVETNGQTVTVTFRNLDTTQAGAGFSFNLVADVKEPGDGTITNQVTPWVNDVEGKSTDESTATTQWGALTVLKWAQVEGSREPLSGAKFKLYTDQATQNEVSAVGELVTGEDGTVNVPVLKPGDYWLKETAAPAGYTQLADPIKVTVTAGGVVTTAGSEKNYVQVENTRQTLPGLPNTGAAGLVALMVFGGGAVVAAVVLAARARRRESAGHSAAS